jgi:hypothetical protein
MRNILFVLFCCVGLFLILGLLFGYGRVHDDLRALIQTHLNVSRDAAFVVILVLSCLAFVGALLTLPRPRH